MSWLTAFHALIGSYLREERGRTALTILGVTLGVAVLVGIDLSNESAVESFRRNLRDIAGEATLTIRGNGARLPGSLVGRAAGIDGIESYAPLIRGDLQWTDPNGESVRVTLIGVDLLASGESGEKNVRPIALRLEPGRNFTSLATDPDVLILSNIFAQRVHATLGDSLRLTLLTHGEKEFRIGAIIESGDLARAYGGNVILTDLGIADHLLGTMGTIDQIDIVTRQDADVEQVAGTLRERFPTDALIERPEQRSTRVESMLAAFRFNLNALGQISLLVGAFLIYNTMKISVVRRRNVIGTLRAMGVGRNRVRAAFLIEGAVFGLIGGVLGVLLGVLMAALMVETVSDAISINFFRADATGIVLTPRIILGGMALGLLFSIVASIGPANEAAVTPPANTMRRGSDETATRGIAWQIIVGFVLVGLAILVLQRELKPGIPVIGYTATVLILAAGMFWARPLLALVCRGLRGVYARILGAEGLLASSATESSLGRASVALGGLYLGVAMTIAVTIMIASFRETVTDWLGQVLIADLYVTPRQSGTDATLAPHHINGLVDITGIERVDISRVRNVVIDGMEARVSGARLDPARLSRTIVTSGDVESLIRSAEASGDVFASESFARKRGLTEGQTLSLPTPSGIKDVRILAIYRDYASEQGYVLMDRAHYVGLYNDEAADSIAIHLNDGAQPDAIREMVAARLQASSAPPVDIRSNRDIRENALRAFDKTFAVTQVLQLIAMLVAILGVATTLLAQLMDRRHEVITLRTLGASRGRVARILILEAGLIGIAGIILGVAGGLVMAWSLTTVVMAESFGWTIGFDIPWPVLFQTVALLFLATLVAGAGPAWRIINGSAEQ